MEKKLEVKNLTISFRTSNGKVQAVRDVNFDLYKGETLAIVGESGSGKSVTSRAIMGILAGNAIVEGGKILYEDKDLLKISEDEFHSVRGDKIAMVFQDPLSSLNPIMRVGAQLTEAMLLKNKANRKESAKNLKEMFKALEQNMVACGCSNSREHIEKFTKFELECCRLEKAYRDALDYANQTVALSEHLLLEIKGNAVKNMKQELAEISRVSKLSCSYFVVRDRKDELLEAVRTIKQDTVAKLEKIVAIEKQAIEFDEPNTFTLGYYLTYVDKEIPKLSVKELNDKTHKETEKGFMDDFMQEARKAVEYSSRQTDIARQKAVDLLKEKLDFFKKEKPDKKTAFAVVEEMIDAVESGLDPLEVTKDSITHTFRSSIKAAIDLVYTGEERNEKEKKRFEKENAKHQAIINKGKVPEWAVIPASYIDIDAAGKDVCDTISEMIKHFEAQINANKSADFAKRTAEIIDFQKEMANNSVNVLSKGAAREKAIKLMESVGISNARMRFKQYPFEFSGGMRQRIVIAIALTANPDVLICDEPTTALDVTIQAQILELINNLKVQRNLSVIFITHDLGVVANMADRIAVMYAGKIVEYGTSEEVFYSPAHPYTWALLASVPDLNTKEKLESIPGTPPNMIYPPKGDAFAERNKYALELDFEMQPPMFRITDTHYAATWLLHEDAPKVEIPAVVRERIANMKKKNGGETK